MLQQVKLHSREFPDICRLQTLVTSDASVKSSAITTQMCDTGIYRPNVLMSFSFISHFIAFFSLIRSYSLGTRYSRLRLHENTQQLDTQQDYLSWKWRVTTRKGKKRTMLFQYQTVQ